MINNIKILYAEDENSIVQFVKILFKKNNISNVTFAKDEKEALYIWLNRYNMPQS